jgi:pimeloyl-ACP methyl ester carboxylesterase
MTAPHLHAMRRLQGAYPEGWVLFLSPEPVERLVVFVHGFRGSALESWRQFPESGAEGDWWRSSDMLYVGYDAVADSITGVAARLRRELPRLYPSLPADLVEIDGESLRESREAYRALVLVGHSLGGVIVRRVLCDVAQAWQEDLKADPQAPRPPLLDAELRLFSPASAGFRAAGWLGLIRASAVWGAVSLTLRRSSFFTDLQPDSALLAETRRRTEKLVASDQSAFAALRASILWANPDNVVVPERYDSDRLDDAVDRTSHRTVCKPTASYRRPWEFVERGLP